MDWSQVVTILGGNIAMFLWAVRQSRKLEENRKEITQIVRAIQDEIKDFHNRLCAIEERNKK